MKYRILQNKLNLLPHVATLPENSLTREIYEIQSKYSTPGLVSEFEAFLVRHDITNLSDCRKYQQKKFIKELIKDENKLKSITS